jgi:tryptophan-rich hypothetical protein
VIAAGGPAILEAGMARRAGHTNPVNFKKISGSKWTAIRPVDRQKHFIVLDWVRDQNGEPTDEVEIEAILTSSVSVIHWRELEDTNRWRIGWQ